MNNNKRRRNKKEMPLQIITINLPEQYLDAIQYLNDRGVYPSRSEAIRTALLEFLPKEMNLKQKTENYEVYL
jgi:Arc/MetJ-type ribon-helix-helix transcriptional regulator